MFNILAQKTIINNHNQTGGNQPTAFSNAYSSGSERWIGLKLGCKVQFVHCLEVCKKNYQFGSSNVPGGPFQCKGPLKFSTFYGLTQMKMIIGYIFAFYATKMGSRDSGETKVDPHQVQDPPWSFNGPCHGPTIHPTLPMIIFIWVMP